MHLTVKSEECIEMQKRALRDNIVIRHEATCIGPIQDGLSQDESRIERRGVQ